MLPGRVTGDEINFGGERAELVATPELMLEGESVQLARVVRIGEELRAQRTFALRDKAAES